LLVFYIEPGLEIQAAEELALSRQCFMDFVPANSVAEEAWFLYVVLNVY
jgi:hypothetical protein